MKALRGLLLVLLGACAALRPPANAVDRYTVDPDHTYSFFGYNHWGLSFQEGRFDRSSGYIELDENAGTGRVAIEIDTASVNAGSAMFDATLRSAAFFDAETYPKISFHSSALSFVEGRLVSAAGELTVKGITRPVNLEISNFNCRFMLLYGKRACGANGTARILRSDFNIGRYVPFVSDEVTLRIAVEAIKDD